MPKTPPKLKGFREAFEAPQELFRGLPELLFLGRGLLYNAKIGLPQHSHPGVEICLIERGKVLWQAGKEKQEVTGGQVYITWPGERHGAVSDFLEPCKLSWLGLDLERRGKREVLGLPAPEAKALTAQFNKIPYRCFEVPPALAGLFEALFEARKGPRSPLSAVEARAALLGILTTLLRAGTRHQPRHYSLMVAESIRLMEQNLAQPLSLPQLTKKLGWSATYFKVRFRKEVGLPPSEFYLKLRLEEACRRLKDRSKPITGIGLDLGFSSSQNFSSAFKRVLGVTPLAYRFKGKA